IHASSGNPLVILLFWAVSVFVTYKFRIFRFVLLSLGKKLGWCDPAAVANKPFKKNISGWIDLLIESLFLYIYVAGSVVLLIQAFGALMGMIVWLNGVVITIA